MNIKYNHYYRFLEWGYKNIPPRIIIEEYIDDNNISDYKFFCYNGNVKNMFIVQDRYKNDGMKVTFFDKNFSRLPFKRKYPNNENKIKKPNNWDEMIIISEILSKPFPFVRVDLYEYNKKVLFGEMTFYPGNGTEKFYPVEWDYILGDMITLPNKV